MADENATAVLGEVDSLTKDPKATEDYSKQTNELLIKTDALSKAGRYMEAVDEILSLEKKARQSSDALSCAKLTCAVLDIFKDANKWESINEYVVLLCKKRGQLKKAIVEMVRRCMHFIQNELKNNKTEKLKLIQTLSAVTEGKIFVEVERARLIRILATMKEEEGDISEAANLLQEVQVETFGAMERREKAEYILAQMRIVLLKKDFVRCQIISKKINTKLIEAEDFEDIKLRYYNYMIEYYIHENKMLDVCKCYFRIFHTKCVLRDKPQWTMALQCYVLYLILSPHEMAQRDMLYRVQEMEKKKLSEMPTFQLLLSEFLKEELMSWPLPYEDQLKTHAVFVQDNQLNEKRWSILRKRVIQHNIKVVSAYYSRITMARLAALLGIFVNEGETEISELVYAKAIHAKIDRPAGVVRFGERKDTADILNEWSGDIAQLLELVEESSHLIQKEKMIHAARAKKSQLDAKAAA